MALQAATHGLRGWAARFVQAKGRLSALADSLARCPLMHRAATPS